ncbi:MAG: HNH endonuclease [Bacteroidales bacterium]|nr:HNH endonuclease [Bacteroidales bacterium]
MNKTENEWKPIPNFEGYYASKDGRVLSNKQGENYIMVPLKKRDGYLYLYLYDGHGNQKKMYLHRLILMAWVRMPKPNEEARHLNDIHDDNRLENLAWGTRMENVGDKRKNGRLSIGTRNPFHKLTDSQVLEIREKYKNGMSSRDIAAEYGVAHTTVLKIARGQKWQHIANEPIIVKHSTVRKDYRKGGRQ